MAYSIFNGELIEENCARISPQDRGFRYGDGIFETLRVHNGAPYQFAWHMRRLAQGLAAIRIMYDVQALAGYCRVLLEKNNITNGLIRIHISRGVGGRGYLPDSHMTPTLLIETMPEPEKPAKPIVIWHSSYQKISLASLPTNSKISQGLNSTLARMEAADNQCFDALLLNEKNELCETSSANIFWVRNNEIYTPSLECGALEGSIRAAVIRLSPYKIYEVKAAIEELKEADEVFITNAAWKILSVSELRPSGKKWQNTLITAELLSRLNKDIEENSDFAYSWKKQ